MFQNLLTSTENSFSCYGQKLITTRSPGTTSVCFSVVTVNDEYRKHEFKIKRRG